MTVRVAFGGACGSSCGNRGAADRRRRSGRDCGSSWRNEKIEAKKAFLLEDKKLESRRRGHRECCREKKEQSEKQANMCVASEEGSGAVTKAACWPYFRGRKHQLLL